MTEQQKISHRIAHTDPALKTIMDASPVGIVAFDDDARVIYVNSSASQLFGKSATAAFGIKCGDFINCGKRHDAPQGCGHTKSCPACLLFHAIGATLSDESNSGIQEGEALLERDAGLTNIWVKYKVSSVMMEGSKVAIMTIDDITGYKQDEKKLRNALAELSVIHEHAPIAMMLVDKDRRVRKINGFAAGFAGRPASEMIGLRGGEALRCLHHLDDPEGCGFGPACADCRVRHAVLNTFESGSSQPDVEAWLPLIQGESIAERCLLISTAYLEIDNTERVLVCVQDITDRKRAEETLRESEANYRVLIENTNDIIYTLNSSGTFIFVSPSWTVLLGHDVSEVEGKDFRHFVHPEDIGKCEDFLKKVIEHQEFQSDVEYRVIHADGSYRWHASNGSPLFDDQRKFISYIGVARDITDRKKADEKLRESEEKYRRITENISDVVWITDLNLKNTYISPSVERLFGEPDAVHINKNMEERFPPDSLDKIKLILAEEIEKEKDPQTYKSRTRLIEVEHYRADGSTIWVSMNVSFIRDENGNPVGIQGVTRNINDRRKAEEALSETITLLQNILDNMHDLISLTDMEGNYKFVNSSFKYLGYELDFLIGKNVLEFVHPDDLPAISSAFVEFLADQKDNRKVEYRYRCADGSYLCFESIGRFIRDNKGNPKEILFSTRNITERKQAEEALLESEQRYREIFNASSEAIFIDDAQTGRILDVNESMVRMYGYKSKKEVLAGNIGDLRANRHPYTEEEAQKITQAAVAGKKQHFEWLAKKRSGELFPVEVTLSRSLIGGHERLLAVVRDITDRKHEEQEREKLRSQFVQAQKMESVGRLAGGVAHDYNNMLLVILGYAELAMEKISPDDPLYTYFEEILFAAKRSSEITRQLLAFARKQTISPRALDLNETVESMLKMLRRLIGEDIDLAWLPKSQSWPVIIDPAQIDQILANLCVNARDAIAGVGKITIETENITLDEDYCADHAGFLPGEFLLLAVSDNGHGMDKETLDNIFEPFFTTKNVGQGTGLGLATVYGIVKQNNGFINVYSEPGKGTTFKIYLPRHAGEMREISAESIEKIPMSHGETVLLVEDEAAIMKMSKIMLENLGYRVLTANTPGEAMRLAEEHSGEIHLLVTDVIMPEMNGRDLADQLHTLYSDIKILFMSGYTADVIARHGVLDKNVHFIQKPFSKKDFAVKIRKALEQP
jgi:two-component system, cell cycle sensor histidine kinase and response regulator CckA